MDNFYRIVLFTIFVQICTTYADSLVKYTTPDYARMHGYPIETHYVTTEDGYILNHHRIPTGRNGESNGKVAYLHHGILVSTSSWLLLGPGKALAYILADQGYDVWMVNTRGNDYSRNHTTLNPDTDRKFWDFSFHEIAMYDLPASIDYVLAKTNVSAVYYCAHSQGSTVLYVLTSERPEYNKKINVYAHLSPIAYLSHAIGPVFRLLARLQVIDPNIMEQLFGVELLPGDSLTALIASTLCQNDIGITFCETILGLVVGFSPDKIDVSVMKESALQAPAGGSSKQLVHFFQEMISGRFCQFDYGTVENLRKYGRSTPPDYNLTRVTAPGYLFYGTNDWVSDYKYDVPQVLDELGGTVLSSLLSFNHQDFLFAVSAPEIYAQILDLFSKY